MQLKEHRAIRTALLAAMLALCVLTASAELHGHELCGRICACHVLHAPYVKLATRADLAPPIFATWRPQQDETASTPALFVPSLHSRAPPASA